MHESSRIEYKRELTDNLERVVVSFLNARGGGAIMLGVDNNGEIIGIGDTDSTQLKIKDRLKNNILLWSLYQATDGQVTEGVKPENEGVKPGNEGVKSENEGVRPGIEGVSKKVKNEISKLYSLICQHPERKSSELSTQIGKSIATTERYLKILKENGFIVYKGAPKTGGYYEG